MKKLLIATTNLGKAREYQKLLADLDLEIVDLNSFADFKKVKESGQTFKENAILKAQGYFSQFHIPCLADDGGFEIDVLSGAPGVISHRWPGYEASDEELVKYTLKKMTGIPWEKRKARIVSWAAFYDDKNLFLENAAVDGYIAEKFPTRIEKGFPWRSILFIPRFKKIYQNLTTKEDKMINQRRKIVEKLKSKIERVMHI